MNIKIFFMLACFFCLESFAQLPAGASYGNYNRLLFLSRPSNDGISGDNECGYWFRDIWYKKNRSKSEKFKIHDDYMIISTGGEIVSFSRDFACGKVPLISGAGGFYIEFRYKLSNNNKKNWPAVWLMPVEHNNEKRDVYGDVVGWQEWMELDVDEGGFGPGVTGTVHSWSGIYPKFSNLQNKNNIHGVELDRTAFNRFGASYDPEKLEVVWWLNDREIIKSGPPYVPMVSRLQNYYIIISNQFHGDAVDPYDIVFDYVAVYVK